MERIYETLYQRERIRQNKTPHPSAGIADSQSVKSAQKGGIRDFDGGKKIKGRKRDLVVDHLGFPIAMELTVANVGGREGLRLLIECSENVIPPILFVDTGYREKDFENECQRDGITLKPVPRHQGWSLEKQAMETSKNFSLVAKRWVVGRSFAWVGKCRRMAKDYELLLTMSKSMLLTGICKTTTSEVRLKWVCRQSLSVIPSL